MPIHPRLRTWTSLLLFVLLASTAIHAQSDAILYCETSPFNTPISYDAAYRPEPRIGAIRPGYPEWSMPIYRITSAEPMPLVTIVNEYSGRVEEWPIPLDAQPAPADDRHMGVIDFAAGLTYEMWDARWQSDGTILAGGMVSFPLDGPGISANPNQRVTAAGFAVSAGMVIREDLEGQNLDNLVIAHALTITLPRDIVAPEEFIAPAVGGEVAGTNRIDGIPMGTRFALPQHVDIDGLPGLHPLSRAVLRAMRNYGLYVNDSSTAGLYNGLYVGTFRMEPGLSQEFFQRDDFDLLMQVQEETAEIIAEYGIYRVINYHEEAPRNFCTD